MNCCSDFNNFIIKEQIFKNGVKHLRKECKKCNKFLGFVQQELKDDYILPFGKHKGELLKNVDKGYLNWLYDQDWVKENLKELILSLL